MQGTGSNDDLAPVENFSAFPACGTDTKRALSVKQKPFNEGVREEPEIGAPTSLSAEIAHRRRYALSRAAADRHRAVAVLDLTVHIRDMLPGATADGFRNRLAEARPFGQLMAAYRDRSVPSVQRPIEVQVVLELSVIREHIAPRPTASSLIHPFFEVFRQTAQRDHRIDARPAAHDPRLLVAPRHRCRVCRRAKINFQIRPEILRPEERG